MPPLLLMLILPVTAAGPADLEADAGWVDVGQKNVELLGSVIVAHKKIDGQDCLRGRATAPGLTARQLYGVASDVASATSWSSWDLAASVIVKAGPPPVYYQLLENPYPLADRYWFLTSHSSGGDSDLRYHWQQVDAAAYPDALADIAARWSGAVSTKVNFGRWRFTDTQDGARIDYRVCSDPGGALPRWAGEFAATRTLPINLRDLSREAARRQ